ncbi:hypothetical protein D3C81_1952470 [compost metagenome]
MPIEHAADAVEVFLGCAALRLHQFQLIVGGKRYKVALRQVDGSFCKRIFSLMTLLIFHAFGFLVTLPRRLVVQVLGKAERVSFSIVKIATNLVFAQDAA